MAIAASLLFLFRSCQKAPERESSHEQGLLPGDLPETADDIPEDQSPATWPESRAPDLNTDIREEVMVQESEQTQHSEPKIKMQRGQSQPTAQEQDDKEPSGGED